MRDDYGRRRFYRDRQNRKIAGVCAGIADYFGFDVTITRLLAVVAFFMAPPVTLLLYFGLVMLVPASDRNAEEPPPERRAFRQGLRSSPATTVTDVKRTLLRLDTRLARLERYVTSSQFELDRKIRNL
ncbi:MAG: envelope stress response membrane protein PspC [Pseudomonadota bacterium]